MCVNVYSRCSPCIGLHGYYLYITRDSNGGLHNNTNNNNNNFIIIITIRYSLSPRLGYFNYSTLTSDSCRNVRVCANINNNWFTTTGQQWPWRLRRFRCFVKINTYRDFGHASHVCGDGGIELRRKSSPRLLATEI